MLFRTTAPESRAGFQMGLQPGEAAGFVGEGAVELGFEGGVDDGGELRARLCRARFRIRERRMRIPVSLSLRSGHGSGWARGLRRAGRPRLTDVFAQPGDGTGLISERAVELRFEGG